MYAIMRASNAATLLPLPQGRTVSDAPAVRPQTSGK